MMEEYQEILNEQFQYEDLSDDELISSIKPRKLEKKSKARTYLQSVIEKIEPCLRWTNETIEQDRRLLYMKLSLLAKSKSDTGVRLIMDWAQGKNLHVKQFIRAVNKALCP